MEDVHGIWMASDHPSRIWFMPFRADHIPQTHQWLIAPRRSFSFGAMELFPDLSLSRSLSIYIYCGESEIDVLWRVICEFYTFYFFFDLASAQGETGEV